MIFKILTQLRLRRTAHIDFAAPNNGGDPIPQTHLLSLRSAGTDPSTMGTAMLGTLAVLPPEMRSIIYRHYFTVTMETVIEDHWPHGPRASRLALLLTSKAISEEAKVELYKHDRSTCNVSMFEELTIRRSVMGVFSFKQPRTFSLRLGLLRPQRVSHTRYQYRSQPDCLH